MQKPSIGRIVHYVNFANQHLAAIVTKVTDDAVHLVVFNPATAYTDYQFDIVFSELPTPDTWHWPEREG